MEIKNLSRKQAKEVFKAIESWIDDGESGFDLLSKVSKVVEKKECVFLMGHKLDWPEFMFDDEKVVLSNFTSDEVDVLQKAISKEIEDLRYDVDTCVSEFDANDEDESIKTIREKLKCATEKAESVELLEQAKEIIASQNVDQLIKEKDSEIKDLKQRLSSALSEAGQCKDRILSAERYIDDLRFEISRERHGFVLILTDGKKPLKQVGCMV